MSRRSSYLITSILFATFSLVSSTSMDVSYAQEASPSDRGPVQETLDRQAAQGASLGSAFPINVVETDNNSGLNQPPSIQESRIPIVQPFEALRQTADSPVYKKQLRQFISMEVPVMFQTMMMVENGAATGFNWSLSALNALNSNWVQSAQFKLDLIEAANSPSADKRGFVEGLYAAQQKIRTGDRADLPGSLLVVMGENVERTPQPSSYSPKSQQPQGATAVDSYANRGSGSTTPPGSPSPPSSSPEEWKPAEKTTLLDVLFEDPFDDDLKNEVANWVGNIERSRTDVNSSAKPIEAKKMSEAKETEGHNIYMVRQRLDKKEVWIALNSAVKSYCDFKQGNPNNGWQVFEKVRPSDDIDEGVWKKVQSLDIKFTISILDQYFNILLYRQPLDEVDCNIFSENDLPNEEKIKGDQGREFDKCQSDNEAPLCLPKRILLKMAEFIAQSRTDYFYRNLWTESAKIATSAKLLPDFNYLYCANLKLPIDGQFDQSMVCDPEDAFQTRIEQNRQDWISFINDFSQLAQGRSGSSPFRPLSSSIQGSN